MMSIIRFTSKARSLVIVIVTLAVILASAVSPQPAKAGTICFVDASAPGPTHDGSSWATAFLTIPDATASPECTTQIWVARGIYYPTATTDRRATIRIPQGVAAYGGFAGTETDLSQRVLTLDDGNFNNDTILSGNIGDPGTASDNSYHVARFGPMTNPNTRLDGFVIQEGNAEVITSPQEGDVFTGGGIAATNATATLANLYFRNNSSGEKGGGLSNSFCHLTVQNVILDGNTSDRGGSLHDYSGNDTYSNVTIRNSHAAHRGGGAYFYESNSTMSASLFENNDAQGEGAGALYVDTGSPTFSNVTFSGNQTIGSGTIGGAITVGPGSTPHFSNILVTHNHSVSDGGGIFNSGNGTFDYVTISENMAGTVDGSGVPVDLAMGGGMTIYQSSPTLTNLRFIHNTATNRGGGLSHTWGASAVISQTLFAENESIASGGGAVEVSGNNSAPTFVNCDFLGNHVRADAGLGGGLLVYDGSAAVTTTVRNSIFWGNTHGSTLTYNQIQVDAPSVLSLEYSDIQGGYTGIGNINADPTFLDADGADDTPGTADEDLHLHWTSPALDAGSNAAVPGSLTTDFDGNARFANLLNIADTGQGTAPVVDMGIYELQPPVLGVDKYASVSTAAEGAAVQYTIVVTNNGAGDAHQAVISDPLPANMARANLALTPPSAGTAGTPPVLFENITIPAGQSVTVTYDAHGLDGPGSVTNTVTVTAAEIPAPGVTDAVTLNLTNAAPTVNAGADLVIDEGTTVHFNGNYNDPAGSLDEPYTLSWLFSGDPTPVTGTLTPDRTYPDNGSFSATLSVTDEDGATTTDTMNITVNNVAPVVNAGPDMTVAEGDTVSFHATATDPGDDTLNYAWDFKDGHTTTGTLEPTHVFVDNGVYNVTLTVSDGEGGTTTDTVRVTVNNANPVVEAGPDQTTVEGTQISVSGQFTDAGANDTHTYSWNFGDGTPGVNTLSATHTYADNGSFTVTLTVTDNNGGVGSDTLSVVVSNAAPTGVNAGPDRTADEGVLVAFNGNATDPGSADVLVYSWHFADGSPDATGKTVNHAFPDQGSYTVTLTVSDDDGGSATDTAVVIVANVAPVVDAGSNQTAGEGSLVTFHGTATDVAADPLTLTWTFGDNGSASGTLNPTHTYMENGVYTVTLTASDDEGSTTSDTLTVTVNNVAPTVEAGVNQTANEGQLVSFNGTASDPAGANDPLTYTWTFGDNGVASGTLTPTHTYYDEGIYTVTLTVSDGDGGVTQDTLTVTVSNVAPTVEAGPDQTVNEGQVVHFSPTVSDPGNDVLTYSWSFGDNSTGTGVSPTHAYGDDGIYTVTLRVTDGDGGDTSDYLTVTVNNVAPQQVNAGQDITTYEGTVVHFSGSFVDPGFLDTHTITWAFGDGYSYTGPSLTPTHTYADDGIYSVTMTVQDDEGAYNADELIVTVNNAAPVVNAGENVLIKPGETVHFNGSYTDPAGENDAPFTMEWDFGDGASAGGVLTPSHTYVYPGTYTVTLRVTDGDGAVGTDTMTVEVSLFNYFLPLVTSPGGLGPR